LKLALVALAGTSTVAGTEKAALLLERLTVRPPDGAAELRVTLQASEPAPVTDALLQLIALSAALLATLSSRANDFETLPALAVIVAVWADVTAETDAVKLALVALAGTTTVPGRDTALLLLAKFTANPRVGAGPVRVTLQLSEPDPDMFAFAQLIALSEAATALS
jgi:hypothetical protein